MLVATHPKAQLVIAGDDPRHPEVRQAAAALPEGSVVLPGRLPESAVPDLYRGAAMVVLPSKAEGFGLPVIEAMACGVPVICSDLPVLHELAELHVKLVPGAIDIAIGEVEISFKTTAGTASSFTASHHACAATDPWPRSMRIAAPTDSSPAGSAVWPSRASVWSAGPGRPSPTRFHAKPATLDTTNNATVIDYTSGSPLATTQNQLANDGPADVPPQEVYFAEPPTRDQA